MPVPHPPIPTGSPQVVVMGVSGVGKTTVGGALAARLGVDFVDADDLHPAANVAKMRAGTPLDDDDRRPWLDLVGQRLAGAATGEGGSDGCVVGCSALKRRYRDQLRAHAPGTVFVHLVGARPLVAARQEARPGHFMPASLLASQYDVLEPLEADEAGFALEVDRPVDAVVAAALDLLDQHDPHRQHHRYPQPGLGRPAEPVVTHPLTTKETA